jgi:RNA polymerase sigma-70 factor (ECF subfamily)
VFKFEERKGYDVLLRAYFDAFQRGEDDVALVLLYLDDMSYREIADVLGVSESNVGVRLNRARKSLAILLDVKPGEGATDES